MMGHFSNMSCPLKVDAALAKERFPEQHAKAMLDRDDTVDVNIADGHPY